MNRLHGRFSNDYYYGGTCPRAYPKVYAYGRLQVGQQLTYFQLGLQLIPVCYKRTYM